MSVSLSLQDVRVTLGGTEILHGVSLDVAEGEFITLLGPSGSGKTTTLNVIAGLEDTTRGHVLFDSRPVEKVPAHQRDIGMVFQSYALFPHMTVGQNVEFGLGTRKVPKAERAAAVARSLALVQLDGLHKRQVRSLSGGQQQRVALARALAPNPSVLLLDEPMAALDKQLRETMQVEIKRIQAEVAVTTVAVTHDQTEALTMSDRVAIMRDGVLEQVDAPEVLYRKPATLFAARFLGEANLWPVDEGRIAGLDTEVEARDGTAVIRPEDVLLATRAPDYAPRLTARILASSFQGTRYRIEAEHPTLGTVVASMPPDVEPTTLAPGLEVQLACRVGGGAHVIANVAPEEAPTVAELA